MAKGKSIVNAEPMKSVFSIAELAQRWGVSRSLVYRLINSGYLKAAHFGKRHIATARQLAAFEASLNGGDPEIST